MPTEKLERLPDKPGVYLMLDERGKVIYVGKASSLKNRVRSYFRSGQSQPAKVKALVQHIADVEYIVTDTEIEALILENNLIKKHRPKYNVSLKDDKTYPYLKVTTNEEFPRIMVTRSMQKDGARYFGPYTRVGAMHETLKLLRRLFPIRSCKQATLERNDRPCLNAHIDRCLAPCSGQITRDEYAEVVKEAILFLEGKQEKLIKRLRERMEQAAERLQFEKAAELRDQITALEQVLARQKIVSSDQEDRDVVAMARGEGQVCVQVFFVRGGKITGREHFFMIGTDQMSRQEVMTAFVKQYYNRVDHVPKEILLQDALEDEDVIGGWLSQKRGNKVTLAVPKRGEKLKLVEMVAKNALLVLEEEELLQRKKKMVVQEALLELQQRLGLPCLPRRIECYDISNIQGSDSVGSMVVFENGIPKNSDYRRFKIKTVQGPDDFASMYEVIARRFARARQEQQEPDGKKQAKFARLPDMVLIDGGKGQLNAARQAMKRLEVAYIPTFGLAKEEELLFSEGKPDPIRLPRDSESLFLLQRIRDEAHRFAVSYHRQVRDKNIRRSILDEIPGIGPKRKKALLRHFGSVTAIRQATLEEIAAVEGMNMVLAETVYHYLSGL